MYNHTQSIIGTFGLAAPRVPFQLAPISLPLSLYIYIYRYVCIYIYIYIQYIHIYIYVYMSVKRNVVPAATKGGWPQTPPTRYTQHMYELYACMYVCMYACMHVCMCAYVCKQILYIVYSRHTCIICIILHHACLATRHVRMPSARTCPLPRP